MDNMKTERGGELQRLVEKVLGKLEAEKIDVEDYDKAVECLSKCVAPNLCIEIYENYINY